MDLSRERMDHITRLVEGGFPLKTDEVEDLHGMNYHLYCLCDTYQAMKIRAENEVETLKAQNQTLRTDAERYRWLRSRDLETIAQGGVFAGMTPQNMVLNEETLDEAVDAAMAQEARP